MSLYYQNNIVLCMYSLIAISHVKVWNRLVLYYYNVSQISVSSSSDSAVAVSDRIINCSSGAQSGSWCCVRFSRWFFRPWVCCLCPLSSPPRLQQPRYCSRRHRQTLFLDLEIMTVLLSIGQLVLVSIGHYAVTYFKTKVLGNVFAVVP